MSKKKDTNEPPSLFDNLDFFATAKDASGTTEEPQDTKEGKKDADDPVPPAPSSEPLRTASPAPARKADAAKKASAILLDHTHNATPCDAVWQGGTLTLKKPDINSAAFLVTFEL